MTNQERETQLETTTEPAQHIDQINAQAWQLCSNDPARASILAQEAQVLSVSGEFADTPYEKGCIESLLNLANIAYYQSQYEIGLSRALEAIDECERTKLSHLLPRALIIVGMCYLRTGAPSEALNTLLRALELSEKIDEKRSKADALNCIAIVYVYHGDHIRGLEYFEKSEKVYHEIGYQLGIAKALMNQCMSHKDLENYQHSLNCGFRALALWREIGHRTDEVMTLSNIGNTYVAMGNLGEALRYFEPSVALVETIDDKFLQVYALLNLGRAYFQHQQYDLARDPLHQALIIAEATNQQGFQFECHELLATLYKAQREFEQALFHHECFHNIKSAVFNEQAENKLKTLEVMFRTEATRQEAKILQIKNAELQREIAERKQAEAGMLEAKRQAEAANRAKTDFLSSMSHELRTPLNAILGYSELITSRQNLPTDLHEEVNLIHRSGRHLLTLLNNVLDLSKIEAGKMTLSPQEFSLPHLLDEVLDLFQLIAKEKKLRLLLQRQENMPEHLCADGVKLRQVLINLIGNALKFTQQGSVVVRVSSEFVRVNPTETQNLPSAIPVYMLQIAVEDSGQGIAPHELPLLFQPFSQTQTGRATQEGTGLGLALSHRIVQLLGGELSVNSIVGQGSIFHFVIPVQSNPSAERQPAQIRPRIVGLAAGQPDYRILVVEDNPVGRKLLLTILKNAGFQVCSATNGLEGVTLWQEWQPHLIWMDMLMPIMDGYEATQIIKTSHDGPPTIVVALTAGGFEENRAAALRAGCDDFLRKPYQAYEVLELIQRRLGAEYVYEQPWRDLPNRQ